MSDSIGSGMKTRGPTIEHLSTELLDIIFANPVLYKHDHINLCRISEQFYRVAVPHVYRNASPKWYDVMGCLRTIHKRPELAAMVRNFTVPGINGVGLTALSTEDVALLTTESVKASIITEEELVEKGNGEFQSFLDVLAASLLPNLTNLTFTEMPSDERYWIRKLSHPGDSFQKLKVLSIQPNSMRNCVLRLFVAALSLPRLQMLEASAALDHSLEPICRHPNRTSNVTHIRLKRALTSARALEELVGQCRSLKTFYWEGGTDLPEGRQPIASNSWPDILAGQKETLEDLTLSMNSTWNSWSIQPSLEERYLHGGFSQFTSLKTLFVDLDLLANTRAGSEEHDSIAKGLPVSIEEVHFDSSDCLAHRYAPWLDHFSKSASKTHHNLKNVNFWFSVQTINEDDFRTETALRKTLRDNFGAGGVTADFTELELVLPDPASLFDEGELWDDYDDGLMFDEDPFDDSEHFDISMFDHLAF
jgi:hypothetical protein